MRVLLVALMALVAWMEANAQYYDVETGLGYNYARHYEARSGRYTASDPIGLAGGVNGYLYVAANPPRITDPRGLWGTDGHDYYVDHLNNFGWGLSAEELGWIKEGSAYVDSAHFQDSGHSYMHAMSSPLLSKKAAQKEWCAFIKSKVDRFRGLRYSDDPRMRRVAYFELGMGLHAVMDSTSPVHSGFQYWGGLVHSIANGYGLNHGVPGFSKEDLATAQAASFETVYKMVLSSDGEAPGCECQ